jgi:putative hydrolase of the HAD superfamily
MMTAGPDITSVYHAVEADRFYNGHVQPRNIPRAVLFDLDDTLFDHEQAARRALERVHASHTVFADRPFDVFEREHAAVLEALHTQVMMGRRSVDEAREERFRRLFAASGASEDSDRDRATAAGYREAYLASRRAVDGALEVLAALKPRVLIGIVSNNLLDEQQSKIRLCRFEPYIDALVVSEAVGVAKPDPAIFAHALAALACGADEAVMIGDSWPADIAGARAAGIRAIWFNRSGRPAPEGAEPVPQISALRPIDALLHAIFGGVSDPLPTDARCASA